MVSTRDGELVISTEAGIVAIELEASGVVVSIDDSTEETWTGELEVGV